MPCRLAALHHQMSLGQGANRGGVAPRRSAHRNSYAPLGIEISPLEPLPGALPLCGHAPSPPPWTCGPATLSHHPQWCKALVPKGHSAWHLHHPQPLAQGATHLLPMALMPIEVSMPHGSWKDHGGYHLYIDVQLVTLYYFGGRKAACLVSVGFLGVKSGI